jgi:hypothetical protein
MSTAAPRRSFFMQYRAEDFPLYLLSLVLAGVLIFPALPHRAEQVALLAGLAYLACSFVMRHGARFERGVFRAVFDGLLRYPGIVARSWRTARHAVIPIAVIFVLALTGERLLQPALAGTRWLRPFPWQWAIWGAFLFMTLFRVSILVAHLLRASVVREVMERSPQRRTIAVLSIHNHIVQAFVTGMVAHLSLVAPCVLFFMWTNPTNLREALLLAGVILWTAIAYPLRKRKVLLKPGAINNRLVHQNHVIAHQSRFYFTVFHGHHHDTLPSAMIGSAAGTGFLENADRALSWLDPLNSIVFTQLNWTYIMAFDMVVHQYIPGVFPFARTTVTGTSHHVTHHFGSALPLGIIFSGYVEPHDMESGYRPDNTITRWFLSEVEQREGLTPELGTKFLSLNDYASRKRSAAMKPTTETPLIPPVSINSNVPPAPSIVN